MARLSLTHRLATLLVALLLSASASAQNETVSVKFTLDWAIQGPQAFFLLAEDRGYFADEGVNITIDRGYGSAGTVSQIAGGAYDIGFADINSMIEFNALNPEQALTAVAVVYNYPPFSILTLDDTVVTPADLAGKELGAPAFDAAYRLFPLFAAATGLDPDSVSWTNMDPALREPTMIRGQIDGIGGFYFTAVLNLLAAGVEQDDITAFLYGDYGVDVYGNAIMAPQSFLEENPEAVRGMMRALTRAWQDMLADPAAAIEAVQAADPLTDPEVELNRLLLAIESNMVTPEVVEVGFGGVDMERLERSIAQVAEVFGLPFVPATDSIYTAAYLPPLEERLPPVLTE